jgi:hypothetical protein
MARRVKVETRFVRDASGRRVHLSTCHRYTDTAIPWKWAEGETDEDLWVTGLNAGLVFCKVCDPCSASTREPFYDRDGDVITTLTARIIMSKWWTRHLKTTNLEFMGHELQVITSFVPVDHGPTHGAYTKTPACWVTEIVGGPPDIDGRSGYSTSPDEAMLLHGDVVAQALASGCDLRQ